MGKLKTKTLWVIAIASGICFVLSPILASPIGTLVDKILLERFEASLPTSYNPSLAWNSLALGEDIFTATTILIALLALVCGSWAAWTLYKRRV